jgi:hypothetical protein
MDDIVRLAMAKWPTVPHCFGWLRLDARGHWRMRDEHAQQSGQPGDKISHAALLDFINRNYQCDASGQWYFQNGPQRVHVDLELAPYIVRTDPAAGLLLHTGAALQLSPQTRAWLTPQGQLLLQSGTIIAALDDRDAAMVLTGLFSDDTAASDQTILAWLDGDHSHALQLHYAGMVLHLQRATPTQLAQQLGFVMQPRHVATAT